MDNLNQCMDLHFQHVQNAKTIVRQKLENVQMDLDANLFEPNTGDGHNHIYKIICGAGKHSKNGAKLKHEIPRQLENEGKDIYECEQHGVVLVRLEKNN